MHEFEKKNDCGSVGNDCMNFKKRMTVECKMRNEEKGKSANKLLQLIQARKTCSSNEVR